MRRLVCSIVFLWLLLPGAVAAQSWQADEVIRQVNGFRQSQGLPLMQTNGQLARAAQQHAEWMAANNFYSHTQSNGSTPLSRARNAGFGGRVSENIVGGTNMTPFQALLWWQNSAVHYRTLVSDYTQIGAGFASGFDQNYYVIVVGRPQGSTASSGGGASVAAAPRPAVAPAPIIVTPIALATAAADGSIVHEVAEGQALWTLAAYYEVTVDYLLRINNRSSDQFLLPGDRVVIQLAENMPTPTPPPTATPPFEHVVRAGQTLWSVAAFYNLSLEELLYLNSLQEDALIQPGDELIVRLRPGASPPPTATPPLYHVVQEGDSLWEIALRYGLTLDELLALNGLTQDALLQPQQQLAIRQTEPPPTATKAPTATLPPTTPVAVSTTPAPPQIATAPTATATAAPTATATPSPVVAADSLPAADLNRMLLLGITAAIVGLAGLIFVYSRSW